MQAVAHSGSLASALQSNGVSTYLFDVAHNSSLGVDVQGLDRVDVPLLAFALHSASKQQQQHVL